jgi:tetratricopeptide (TPR) repeat protein
MARDGRIAILCAGLLLGALSSLRAAPGDETDSRLRGQLAVQAALEQGLDHLQRGNYEAAVRTLESQISRIDGNRRYLMALRDAYRGYLRELERGNRLAELKTYQTRLDILDSPGRRSPPASKPTPPATRAPSPATALAGAPVKSPPEAHTLVPRGKIEDDPFADSNSAEDPRARGLLTRAEKEFADRRYEVACEFYEQANKADSSVTADSRERWAYCKLYRVAKSLNESPDSLNTGDLEKDVRHALVLAPRLDRFGKDLLSKIDERRGAGRGAGKETVTVKHTPRSGAGWALAETANFRIFHTQSREYAEKATRVAETTRAAMTHKWFGEAPTPWTPRCDVYLHANAQDYSKATGAPKASPGHSTISLDSGRVLARRIDLRCDDTNLINAVLPHETTHIVLAGRFGKHHVPRWADEGIAVLSEPQDRINLHLRNLPMHRRDGHLFGLGQLMQMDRYPDPRYIGPFYAQSVSLVEFLAKKKGAPAFTRFLREALDSGFETALRKHYGYRNFTELDQQWRGHAFGSGAVAGVSGKR